MTIQQLLCPAVLEWTLANKHLPEEEVFEKFNEWFVNNQTLINESVESNLDKINEYLEKGKLRAGLLLEGEINVDDIDWDDIPSDGEDDEPISGKVDDEDDDEDDDDEDDDELSDKELKPTVSGKLRLSSETKDPNRNIFSVVNSLYSYLEENKLLKDRNTHFWESLDVSNVLDMTALFAFADIRNADLKSWDVSKVRFMEGMFYKSTFNNNSICGWDVRSCSDFFRMFTFSDFNQDISGWKPAYVEQFEYDADGNLVYDADGFPKKIKVRAELPLIGAAADEKAEMVKKRLFKRFDALRAKSVEESNTNNIYNKSMKHLLDFETFINEGFGDFVKKSFNKIKSFFKNMVIKMGNFVAMFNNEGDIIDASSPYTALNYISDGEVDGVTAFTSVKNEYLNDNVKSTANIVESPEYYGIINKDSIEYRNYQTMVAMVNEHYSKYGEPLNEEEERVGFSGKSGGIMDILDINSDKLIQVLNTAIKNVPAYKGKNHGGAVLIWGAPGIGKSTIPSAVIKAWNERNDENNQKALMVVECGDLAVDGFSLPMPITKTIGDYLDERPKVNRKLKDFAGTMSEEELTKVLDEEIKVSGEAVKTWLPVYKLTSNQKMNKIQNSIANGHIFTDYKFDDTTGEYDTVVTETTEGGIILFDEFFRANEQIFKILMQILLNRRFNSDYQLGDKWAIIACSNRPLDDDEVERGYEATGAVVGTRFSKQYNFIPNFDDWKKWAVKYGYFDDATITFLMQEKDPATGEYTNWHTVRPGEYKGGKSAWPVPRTWSQLMVALHNIMEDEGYSSILEIPSDTIMEQAAGAIGVSMAEKYVEFLSAYNSKFSPGEVLNNPKYTIPKGEMKCGEVIDRLSKYIDLTFDSKIIPTDEQMMNMFNTLERTYNASKDNYIRPLYVSIFNKFGFLENASEFAKVNFPNFIKAFMEKYGLTTAADIKKFIV